MTVPVIVQGLGPMGLRILEGALRDPALRVLGGVDVAPDLVGRPLADLVPGAPPGLVHGCLAEAADAHPPGTVVLQAIGSRVAAVVPVLDEAAGLGLHVVSTCEELAWPYARHDGLVGCVHHAALASGVTLVATGVNPGFLMDRLVVALRSATHDVRRIRVERVQDPRPRRLPFREKVGVGLARAAWDDLAATGTFGHVGLEESARLVAAGFGWEIERFEGRLEPVQPDPDGPVLGTLQELWGETADGRRLELHFAAHSGVAASYDAIRLDGTPPISLRFDGGVFGDDATVAAVLAAARVIPRAPRGLVTVLDLPLR